MKYMIILGFFATILAVSAKPSGIGDVCRIPYPQRWVDAGKTCIEAHSREFYTSFMTCDKTGATRMAKCLAWCIHGGSGEFADGRFDPIALENFLRGYVGFHQSLDKLVKIYKAAAAAGNAEVGDHCDKAFAYYASLCPHENQRVLEAIFYIPD